MTQNDDDHLIARLVVLGLSLPLVPIVRGLNYLKDGAGSRLIQVYLAIVGPVVFGISDAIASVRG